MFSRTSAVVSLVALACPLTAQAIFSPLAAATGVGNVNNTLPFAQQSYTYQQVHSNYSLSTSTVAIVTRMQFRSKAATTGGSCDLELYMSQSPNDSQDAVPSFAGNVTTGTEINVFTRKTINLPSIPTANTWGAADLTFDVPYILQPTFHMSWRVVIHSNASTPYTLDCYSDWRNGTPSAFGGCQHPVGTQNATQNTTFRSPGNDWNVNGYSYLPNTVIPGALMIGGSNVAWGSIPLPFDMGTIGAPGCQIVNDPAVVIPGVTGSFPTGFMGVVFPTPNDPSIVGGTIYTQFVFVEAGANAIGLFTSAGRNNVNIPAPVGVTRVYASGTTATTGTVGKQFALPIGLN